MGVPAGRAGGGDEEGASHEDPGHVALVLGGAVQVGRGLDLPGGQRSHLVGVPLEVGEGPAGEPLLGGGRPPRPRADAADDHAGTGDRLAAPVPHERDGHEVLTVEGLAVGERLDPLQEAFMDHGAVQCGFCTAGMLLTARSLLNEEPSPSPARVAEYLRGNLCRCTGYRKILDAILACARPGGGER